MGSLKMTDPLGCAFFFLGASFARMIASSRQAIEAQHRRPSRTKGSSHLSSQSLPRLPILLRIYSQIVMFKPLGRYCFVLIYLLLAILALPSTKPGSVSLTAPIRLQPNSSQHGITRLRDDQIDCIKRPRMYQIDKDICKPVMDRILELDGGAEEERMFNDPTTKLGGSPCYLQLKRSQGSTVIVVSLQDIVVAANGILDHCSKFQGAGWAQFFPRSPWYLLIYGDAR